MNTTHQISVANNGSMQSASCNEALPFELEPGFIHTTELRIFPREGIDVETSRNSRVKPKRISYWRPGKNGSHLAASCRYNPNLESVRSPYSRNMVRIGNCLSLSAFEKLLTEWAKNQNYERSDIGIKRADFAIDCRRSEDADLFRKLSDLLIAAFIVSRNVKERDEFYSESFMTLKHKSFKATAPKQGVEIEKYNKLLQDPRVGAFWRLEFRYRFPRKKTGDVNTALNQLIRELKILPRFYGAALNELNKNLFEQFIELQAQSDDKLHANQFVLQHSSRFFNHLQVRKFLAMAHGITEKQAECRAKHYVARHRHLFISKKMFQAFVKAIIEQMQKYTNDGTFSDNLKIA